MAINGKLSKYKQRCIHISRNSYNNMFISNYTVCVVQNLYNSHIPIPNSVKNITGNNRIHNYLLPNSLKILKLNTHRKNYNRKIIECNIIYKNITNVININNLWIKCMKTNICNILKVTNICFIKISSYNYTRHSDCIKKTLIFLKNTNKLHLNFGYFKGINDISILRNIKYLFLHNKHSLNDILNNVHTLIIKNCNQNLLYIKNICILHLKFSINVYHITNIRKIKNICLFKLMYGKMIKNISMLSTIRKLFVCNYEKTKLPNLKYIDNVNIILIK